MSLEIWNTLATFGTFFVISATAIAAVLQLRHARGSNQISALNELRETTERPEFQAARHFVVTQLAEKMSDPEFRYQVEHRTSRTAENGPLIDYTTSLGNFYESMAVMVRQGFVDREVTLEMMNFAVVYTWEALRPVTAIYRRAAGSSLWENFEYLTVLSQDWLVNHSEGTYPRGVRRIDVEDVWRDDDLHYAASRSSSIGSG
jgi:hypothetical protein